MTDFAESRVTPGPQPGAIRERDIAMLQAVLRGEVTGSGSVAVRRKVAPASVDNVVMLADVVSPALASHPDVTYRPYSLGVSLLTGSEGRKITKLWINHFDELEDRVTRVTQRLPSCLKGYIGRAVIVGQREEDILDPKVPGARFVGFRMNAGLTDVLRRERHDLLRSIGRTGALRAHTIKLAPHIGLFKTEDPELADQLRVELDKAKVAHRGRVHVNLAKPAVMMPHQIQPC